MLGALAKKRAGDHLATVPGRGGSWCTWVTSMLLLSASGSNACSRSSVHSCVSSVTRGFSNSDLRTHVAALLGVSVELITPGRMTYDLRRLRLHGLITRRPRSRRYMVTQFGFRAAIFLTRSYNRLLRPGLALLDARDPPQPAALRRAILNLDQAIDRLWRDAA